MFKWLTHWMRSWFSICLLRRKPQQDPLSCAGLSLALLLYIATDVLVAGANSGWLVAWGMTGLDVLVLVLVPVILLQLTGRRGRLLQTLTAMAGTGGLLGLLVLPVVQQGGIDNESQQTSGLLVIFWLVMMIWSVVVRAHIYRHALSVNYAAATAVAIVQSFMVFKLVDHLFPQVG